MARRRYRRYFKRKSGRWSANIDKISATNEATSGEFYNPYTLCENPIQSSTGITQTYTVKNFEISFVIDRPGLSASYSQDLESITAYIMYVPQGMNVTSAYYAEHPEYILAYKFLGQPNYARLITSGTTVQESNQQYQPFKIKTRMARKLQSGDSIILYIQGSNQSATTTTYNIDGIVRWWTKAN